MRSLQKNFDNLYHFLSTFPTKPDVICISETKIKDKPLLNISIPGYIFLHVNSSTNAGGVGICIIDTLQYEEITLQTEFFGCENLWVRIKSTISSTHYIIGTIYRHPTSNMKDFSDYLNNSISELNDTKSYYFILGDININTSSQSNNIVTNYLNMLDSNSVASLINKPTRVTDTFSSTLDHILTNENRFRISPFVLNHVITDHYPVMVSVSQNVIKCKTQPKFKRSLANFSADNFNADLHESLENLSETVLSIDENNVISVFEQFYSLVQTTIDKHAPLKQLSRKQKKLQSKPWISKGILKSIKRKQKMHKTHFINGSMSDKHFYKRYTNLLTRVKSLAKKLFYFHEFSTFKNNPRKTWEVLRSILSSKSATSAPNIINIDGKCFTNPSEIAEKFNHHFANVGKSLVAKQNNVDDEKYLSYLKSPSPTSIYLKPTDPYEIKCAINKLSLSKASGYDDILPFF